MGSKPPTLGENDRDELANTLSLLNVTVKVLLERAFDMTQREWFLVHKLSPGTERETELKNQLLMLHKMNERYINVE